MDLDVEALRAKNGLFQEMREAIDAGAWDEATYKRLRAKAKEMLPKGIVAPFLAAHAKPEWREPGDLVIGKPLHVLN